MAHSRGRHANELFIVTEDHRTEDRHAVEVDHEPLEDLRTAIRRNGGKQMALD